MCILWMREFTKLRQAGELNEEAGNVGESLELGVARLAVFQNWISQMRQHQPRSWMGGSELANRRRGGYGSFRGIEDEVQA